MHSISHFISTTNLTYRWEYLGPTYLSGIIKQVLRSINGSETVECPSVPKATSDGVSYDVMNERLRFHISQGPYSRLLLLCDILYVIIFMPLSVYVRYQKLTFCIPHQYHLKTNLCKFQFPVSNAKKFLNFELSCKRLCGIEPGSICTDTFFYS